MSNRKHSLNKLSVIFLMAAGLIIAPMAMSSAAPVSASQMQDSTQASQQSGQDQTFTGTIIVQSQGNEQTYWLDTNGDGDGNYQLQFSADAQQSDMPSAGEQVTVQGTLHGTTLEVKSIEKK